MIVCPQCGGKGAVTPVNDALIDANLNTNYPNQNAIPCSQCNGKGYYSHGS